MVATSHNKMSMSTACRALPPRGFHRPRAHAWLATALAAWAASATCAAPATTAGASCTRALGVPAVSPATVRTLGTEPTTVDLALSPGEYLIEVAERDNDAVVEVLGPKGEVLAESDHPERRTGTRRAVVTAQGAGVVTVRITGKEHANAAGTATVRAFDLAGLQARPDCLAIMKALAAADADYAAGQAITRGHNSSPSAKSHDLYVRAMEEYSSAQAALAGASDRALRGQTELAVAALNYEGLQDWVTTAKWAQTAAATLSPGDRYRRARAEALLAAAWIELGRTASSEASTDLVVRARIVLGALRRFHLQRGERYDAALQIENIAVTYLDEGRFADCVTASETSARLFGSVHESQRRGQAWQNEGLCLWGMGRLPEAMRLLERGLADIRPEPVPFIYLSALNNTALADYAEHHFDESLQLFDRALKFAEKVQFRRAEGQSLYGIGMNYYAIGDRIRAREFLERSLAIRTVALDRRGRMATVRALATVDADDGRTDEAIAWDREALRLAVSPASIERIRIQLAVHVAAAGRLDEAKAELDGVISSGTRVDPGIQAEALLQRAVLLRKMDRIKDGLADLAQARPRLHRLGNVTEEFAANLELARTLRLAGDPKEALAAVDEALQAADAVRLQTVNPQFRLQLQAPLRAAYDLKIELLRARYADALAVGRQREADGLAAAAFAAADASRARSLADLAAQEYSPELRWELAPEFRRRESLYEELAGRQFALEQHFDHAGSLDARSRGLIGDIAELERQLDRVNTVIASRANRGKGSARPNDEHVDVTRVPAHTAIVSYWLGAESAYAWVVLPEAIRWTQLSSPEDISKLASEFHRSLSRFVADPVGVRLQDSRALSEKVLAPIESQFRSVTQWVFIPDGALDYVPFAALRTSAGAADAFVVMRHDVAVAPAAWMLDTRSDHAIPQPPRALLLVADPVYQADDPRLEGLRSAGRAIPTSQRSTADPAHRGLQRLPFSAQEAAGIAAEFPHDSVDELIGLDATRARLLSLDWSNYRFIHIATHGIVDAQVPDLSALMLGSYDARGDLIDGGAVRVADLSLRKLRAEVVVFSACDTALGKQVPSEGLVGLTSTVLARGAKAVVASLWPVSDEMGAQLMTELYRHLLRESMSAPAALGAALRSVLSRNASADPALWAAFQVYVVALGPGLPIRDDNTATTTRP
jgi:CHAT domain-containing protein/tetratricopeptide (TPR) repeat protein